MIVRIDSDAEAELEAAFHYYQKRREGLGHDFVDDYVHGTHVIAAAPTRWPEDRADSRARRFRLDTFPFSLVYQIFEDHCLIVAIAHQSKRPGYWRDRLR